ncbi:hypothetical protein K4K54_004428 [Colletotrichum sp. SAR 10_86]|nr:hypothetical protein K4K54_004428 [Colletotrichum sp. SAR 10_86]
MRPLSIAAAMAVFGACAADCNLACNVLADLPKEVSGSPEALLSVQRDTTAIWAKAYADKDVDTLVSYVVDPYIQHSPAAPSGKTIAEAGMKIILTTPGLINNVSRIISDLNFAVLHTHRIQPNTTDKAIVDIFRLDGTCIIEHWDVQQIMTPSTVNPIAYF